MKKINVIFNLVVMILLTTTVHAKTASTFEVTAQANYLVIKSQSSTDQEVKLKLRHENGEVLYRELTSTLKFVGRKYDVNEFPLGNYVLEITKGNVYSVHPFTKSSTGLLFDKNLASTVFAPSIKQSNGFVDLNMLCLADCEISIRVYDKNGETLYFDKHVTGQKIEKRFDLSQAIFGEYTFAIRVSSPFFKEVFMKTIETLPAYAALK